MIDRDQALDLALLVVGSGTQLGALWHLSRWRFRRPWKAVWLAVVLAVGLVGPLAYFVFSRRHRTRPA